MALNLWGPSGQPPEPKKELDGAVAHALLACGCWMVLLVPVGVGELIPEGLILTNDEGSTAKPSARRYHKGVLTKPQPKTVDKA